MAANALLHLSRTHLPSSLQAVPTERGNDSKFWCTQAVPVA